MTDFNRNDLQNRKLAEFEPPKSEPVKRQVARRPEPEEIYEEEDETLFSRIRIFVPIIVVAIICFVSYAWYTDKFAISRDSKGELPIVKASHEPLRIKPEDPGGMKIVNRDKTVYDTISGKDGDASKKAENVLPAPEEPISRKDLAKELENKESPELINKLADSDNSAAVKDKPKDASIAASAVANVETAAGKTADDKSVVPATDKQENIAATPTEKPATTAIAAKPAPVATPTKDTTTIAKADTAKTAKTDVKTPTEKPVTTANADNGSDNPAPATPAKTTATTPANPVKTAVAKEAAPIQVASAEPAKPAETHTEKAVTADDITDVNVVSHKADKTSESKKSKKPDSGYRVQLGSYRTEGDAEVSWKSIKKKFSDITGDADNYIEKADLGEKGIFYRLQLAGIKNEADARKVCQRLIEKKQECFFVGK